MDIQDIKGKATLNLVELEYAMLDDEGILYWFNKNTDKKTMPVNLACINIDTWQPYHPQKEIVPTEAGELWETPNGDIFCTVRTHKLLLVSVEQGTFWNLDIFKADWTRIHPSVEADKEKIVIEGVGWFMQGGYACPIPEKREDIDFLDNLKMKPPMTMTLTWDKEKV